ncbi:MAG: NAD-dependent epimerase/dehydratase family protein [Armatimonadota bacterium]|nr:NAD-dependent epimerase/dehydratase family protein [Armatimonadota bacterium]
MKVLITGNLGFVGQETQRLLESEGHEVIGYDIMDGRDIRREIHLAERPDRILHLAAITRFEDADGDPKLAFETNVLGTRNVLRYAANYSIPMIYASTGSVYMPIKLDPPITEEFPARGNSVYGCTKYVAELYTAEHSPHIILRYAHLYGREKRGHGLIGGFLDRINRGMAPTLYGGKQGNDFTYVKDVAMANYLALTASWDKWNQVYNIGTGEELSAEEAGTIVCEMAGYHGEIERIEQRAVDASRFVFDISKARKMLRYEPQYSFREGLRDMFAGDGAMAESAKRICEGQGVVQEETPSASNS